MVIKRIIFAEITPVYQSHNEIQLFEIAQEIFHFVDSETKCRQFCIFSDDSVRLNETILNKLLIEVFRNDVRDRPSDRSEPVVDAHG